jgi:uncharacterized protein (TIGR02266 family)
MEDEAREFVTPEVEKRRHRRASLVTEVKCDPSGKDELLVTRDVSTGGLFIITKKPLPMDSSVSLSFNLGDGHPLISCRGKVVYSMQGMGMGIQFMDLPDESLQSLQKFVDEAS